MGIQKSVDNKDSWQSSNVTGIKQNVEEMFCEGDAGNGLCGVTFSWVWAGTSSRNVKGVRIGGGLGGFLSLTYHLIYREMP